MDINKCVLRLQVTFDEIVRWMGGINYFLVCSALLAWVVLGMNSKEKISKSEE